METEVRTKFKVDVVTKSVLGTSIHFSPVLDGSEENTEFAKELPTGGLELIFADEKKADQFAVGDYAYVDITPAKE
jgi:hypothetical protein